MSEIPTKLKCHCGGAVVHNLQKVYSGNNGIIGSAGRAFYDMNQSFNCSDCGCVYVPTKKNRLKVLPEAEANEAFIKASK